MIQQIPESSLGNQPKGQDAFRIETCLFQYKKYNKTIFVSVFPRAHLEEVISINSERRTVTARFIIFITICLKTDLQHLKEFLKRHLILQFDYNQVIYIPQLMKIDNPPFIIQEVVEADSNEDYITYKIKGNFECSAIFDFMFFPYRQIEVVNHLVIRSQVFQDYVIKYNAMMAQSNDFIDFHQFSPHIIHPQFAGYSIVSQSTQICTDQSKYNMKKLLKKEGLGQYLIQFIKKEKITHNQEVNLTPDQITKLLFEFALMEEMEQGKKNENKKGREDKNENENMREQESVDESMEELCPFKHVTFKFEMASLKFAYVLQNQIPIWALGVISLYLFTSNPDIGNRYGNAILIIVSMTALLTNYRLKNITHHSITFYEIKMMVVMIVPILLIISTAIDYYSNSNLDLSNFFQRDSQIQNPFMLVSIIVYSICFGFTFLFFICMAIATANEGPNSEDKAKALQNEFKDHWSNIQELLWQNSKLFQKLILLMKNKKNCLKIHKEENKKKLISSAIARLKASRSFQIPLVKHKSQNPTSSHFLMETNFYKA